MEVTIMDLNVIEIIKVLCKCAQVILLLRLHELIQDHPRYQILNNMLLLFALFVMAQIWNEITSSDFINFGKGIKDLIAAGKAIVVTIILYIYANDLSTNEKNRKRNYR